MFQISLKDLPNFFKRTLQAPLKVVTNISETTLDI